MIPYGHQSIDPSDVRAVLEALQSDWLTQGPRIDEFEAALCSTTEARYAVAFSSGTAALHAAAAVADLGPGDLVFTSPLSFVASANCVRYMGATPAFVDIQRETLNLDLERVPGDAAGVVAVHYAGLPVDLTRLRVRPRIVIEDASHALGARTSDGPVGNCAHSDMCTFSFHPVKAVTTGEGGAVTTNSVDLASRLRRFRNHGIVKGELWEYDVAELGFNYRLTDVQAALGLSQLQRLDGFVSQRNRLALRYCEAFLGTAVEVPPVSGPGDLHAYHLFPVQVDDRRRVFESLRDRGVGVQVHYVPIYRHSLYRDRAGPPSEFPVTEAVYERLISLPLYPDLRDAQQDCVIDELLKLL